MKFYQRFFICSDDGGRSHIASRARAPPPPRHHQPPRALGPKENFLNSSQRLSSSSQSHNLNLKNSFKRSKPPPPTANAHLHNSQAKTPKRDLKIKDRIVWLREPPNSNEHGIVKWLNLIDGELIAGIEFDNPLSLGSGWYQNKQLFSCSKDHGGLVSVAGLILEKDFNPNDDNPLTSTSSTARRSKSMEKLGEAKPLNIPVKEPRKNEKVLPPTPSPSPNDYNIKPKNSKSFFETSTSSSKSLRTSSPSGGLPLPSPSRSPSPKPLPVYESAFNPPPKLIPLSKSKIGTLLPSLPYIEPPLNEIDTSRINGRQRGIQGNRNSCYLDATLFSMFSFSSVFDYILSADPYKEGGETKENVDGELGRKVQSILRDNIVNSLRREFYTPASEIAKLRSVMQHLDDKLASEEMDPQEFLQILFSKVLHLQEFLSLSSGQSDFFHQVLATPEGKGLSLPSVQSLFEQSLMLQGVKLKRIPTPALIIQMPRYGNDFKMFEGIFPNLSIDITDLIENSSRVCIICGQLARWECLQCYGLHKPGSESTAFCEECLISVHKHPERGEHEKGFTRIEYSSDPSTFPNIAFNPSHKLPNSRSKWDYDRPLPRVTLELFAVICIETSHFVSFVKCGNSRTSPWAFFDSMADRVENYFQGGQNIPQVKILPNMGTWLHQLENDQDISMNRLGDPDLKRLLSDPYICLYHAPKSSMYT